MIRSRLALFSLSLAAAAPLAAATWTHDPAASTLSFHGSQGGEAFDGRFTRFTPKIAFDPATPDAISIDVEIDTASADTQNAERDDALKMPEFFWIERFKSAHFRTTACRAVAPPKYECDAQLTIRDQTHPLKFPFTWTGAAGAATLEASVTLNRTDYDVGTGDWATEEVVLHPVEVRVKLALKQ